MATASKQRNIAQNITVGLGAYALDADVPDPPLGQATLYMLDGATSATAPVPKMKLTDQDGTTTIVTITVT